MQQQFAHPAQPYHSELPWIQRFVRAHRALKFGGEVRTPALQAGLTARRLPVKGDLPTVGSLSIGETHADNRPFRSCSMRHKLWRHSNNGQTLASACVSVRYEAYVQR